MIRYEKPIWRALVWSVFVSGLITISAFWWHSSGPEVFRTASNMWLGGGHLLGLFGAYLILWQLVLRSRLPIIENAFGMDDINVIHSWNGKIGMTFILIHPIFLSIGYSLVTGRTLIAQLINFILTFEDVFKAFIGTLIFIAVITSSIYLVRRKLAYELWYFIHLFTYLAIALVFFHQLRVGPDFIVNASFRWFWYGLYVAAFGSIALWRFTFPIMRMFASDLRVSKVVRENDNVVSVYMRGRQLKSYGAQPGQFMIWRFLDRDRFWQAHPFSFSLVPGESQWRITVKDLGDFTSQISSLRPGTSVLADGPHGKFVLPTASSRKLLFIAGGIGITPIRSMIDDKALSEGAALIYSCRTESDAIFASEIDALSKARSLKVHYIYTRPVSPAAGRRLDAQTIAKLVPDIAERTVYICGLPAMMDSISASLRQLGVPASQIMSERFDY